MQCLLEYIHVPLRCSTNLKESQPMPTFSTIPRNIDNSQWNSLCTASMFFLPRIRTSKDSLRKSFQNFIQKIAGIEIQTPIRIRKKNLQSTFSTISWNIDNFQWNSLRRFFQNYFPSRKSGIEKKKTPTRISTKIDISSLKWDCEKKSPLLKSLE